MIKLVLTLVLYLNPIKCRTLESLIYNGEDSNITDFPHSTCLSVKSCNANENNNDQWMCGSSILNQKILLSAAHCVYGCTARSIMCVQFGNADRRETLLVFVKKHAAHENYSEIDTSNDIALVELGRPLELSSNVGRVAIYPKKYTPYLEVGVVAGWGNIDDVLEIASPILHHTTQKIMKRLECQKVLGRAIPKGVICGGEIQGTSYAAKGDSGSALMVQKYIQVGVVSYKLSQSITVYTDVGYYYDWIIENVYTLVCCD